MDLPHFAHCVFMSSSMCTWFKSAVCPGCKANGLFEQISVGYVFQSDQNHRIEML